MREKKNMVIPFWIVFLLIVFVLIIFLFFLLREFPDAEKCYSEYLINNSIYVGQMNNSYEAIEKVKRNSDIFGSEYKIIWNRVFAEYSKNLSYAGEPLESGWYVYLPTEEGGHTVCCRYTGFISDKGYLMRYVEHPC